jgi:F-type H+-transporting ATPase subunit b
MGLFEALGINYKILIAQFVNFAVLVFVLWRFAYKPVLKILEDRRKKVEGGVLKAQEAEEKLKQAKNQEDEILVKAKKEALKIVEQSKERAEVKYNEIIKKSKEDIGLIINEEKEKIRQEKAVVLEEIREEVADLITAGIRKFLEKKVDDQEDKKIVNELVEKL